MNNLTQQPKTLQFNAAYYSGASNGEMPAYLFLHEIQGLGFQATGTNSPCLNIMVDGNATAMQVVVSDANDSAAMVSQIFAAYASQATLIEINGNPSAPATPTVTLEADYGQIEVSWTTGGTTVTQYIVLRGTSYSATPLSDYTQIAVVGVNQLYHADGAVDNTGGQTYYYAVVASNSRGVSTGNGSNAGAACLTVSAPSGLVAAADYYSIDLAWSAPSITPSPAGFALSYNVLRDGSIIGNTSNDTYVDFITDGNSHTYTVEAVINGVVSSASYGATATANSLSAPTGLSATAGVYSVALAWTAVTGATSYNIYRSNTSGQEVLVASTAGANYTDTGLDYNQTWYYKVTATVNGGESAKSSEVNATPINATFVSASPNPASATNGGVLTFTGSGFDPSQGGQMLYGVAQQTYLPVTYINSVTIQITVPGGLSPGTVQFYYIVGGGQYQLPFTVSFA